MLAGFREVWLPSISSLVLFRKSKNGIMQGAALFTTHENSRNSPASESYANAFAMNMFSASCSHSLSKRGVKRRDLVGGGVALLGAAGNNFEG